LTEENGFNSMEQKKTFAKETEEHNLDKYSSSLDEDMKKYTGSLMDPFKTVDDPAVLKALSDKISDSKTRMFRKPENGGNPFLFIFAASKPHILARKLPSGREISTAATNGKVFFWNPEFLDSLNCDECSTVMQHETLHIIFFHCERLRGRNENIAAISIDYVVNSTIEKEHEELQRSKAYKLWGVKGLGSPTTMSMIESYLDGKTDLPEGKTVFSDISAYGRAAEDIYDQIYSHYENSPRRCVGPKTGGSKSAGSGGCGSLTIDPKTGQSKNKKPFAEGSCPHCGAKSNPFGSLDDHMMSDAGRQDVMADVMRAAEAARAMGRGFVPSSIETLLARLEKPVLMPHQIIQHAIQRKSTEAGNRKDYSRYRRRFLSDEFFIPKMSSFKPRWLAMIDTSGSMSDGDIANGLKELQAVGDAEGYVIPCDASPKWDSMVKITQKTDLQYTKIVGRGGTVFDEFFQEYPRRLGTEWDVIVIISDGDCGNIPMNLKPKECGVLWIITNQREFTPSFGRVCHLNPSR
jgi:predicted metal-dependent peptidase